MSRRSAGWGLLAPLTLLATPAQAQQRLSRDEVLQIVERTAGAAAQRGLNATIAVTDREGRILAVYRMAGAPLASVVPGRPAAGLEGTALPSDLVAVTKAGTGAFLSTAGHAFSTRTASFIVQTNFPPGFAPTGTGGPLFGVQFSSLPCSDVRNLPLGLSGDAGGIPLYKGGELVGGLGVEGDSRYGVDDDPLDFDEPAEEVAAVSGAQGLEPPDLIRAERIVVDGIALPFVNARPFRAAPAALGGFLVAPRDGGSACLQPASLDGVAGFADPRFPARAGRLLAAAEVERMLANAARQAERTRAAIRQPLGDFARVSIAVVDVDGAILGLFQSRDAPRFGQDVAVQKARTAAFFSGPGAADTLRRAGLSGFVTGEVPLDGSVAYTTRAVGYLAQPFYPPGIAGTTHGPLSLPIRDWSPFNTGAQLELVLDRLRELLASGIDAAQLAALQPPGPCEALPVPRCSAGVPSLPNGITIFPGGAPLFKGGLLAGAIGISGDGVDQDDLIAAAGSVGFEPTADRRCDRLVVRGARLPYLKFPRQPENQ
jgi:uncharacterized protein GlcG (DUF336 family)